MKHYFIKLSFLLAIIFSGCNTTTKISSINKSGAWHFIGNIEGVEVYIDTLSIKQEGTTSYAREKRVYVTQQGKDTYIKKIRDEYAKMGKPEKTERWNEVSYSIYHCVYECTNRRFKVMSVEDFDIASNRILKTVSPKKTERWLDVSSDTLGDHTTFFVCDF